MSRLTTMSPAALKAIFSPESDASLITLLTIYPPDGQTLITDPKTNSVMYDPANPSPILARLCDGYTGRLPSQTNDAEVVYGVISGGEEFTFIPMEITLPTEEEAQAPRCSIVIRDITQVLVPIIRQISGPPKIRIDIVLDTSPDIYEASFTNFYINAFTYNAEQITADLSMINYDLEPFPIHRFSPQYFPGLF